MLLKKTNTNVIKSVTRHVGGVSVVQIFGITPKAKEIFYYLAIGNWREALN